MVPRDQLLEILDIRHSPYSTPVAGYPPPASCCYQRGRIIVSSSAPKTGPKSTRSLAARRFLLLSAWRDYRGEFGPVFRAENGAEVDTILGGPAASCCYQPWAWWLIGGVAHRCGSIGAVGHTAKPRRDVGRERTHADHPSGAVVAAVGFRGTGLGLGGGA